MSWERVRGHGGILNTFRAAQARGRFGQAYLFVGPAGIGKHLFARQLAKALLCERPPEPLESCDQCPSCTQVEAGTHPDVFSVRTPDDKHELPVESIREFCSNLAVKSRTGSKKIGIVEDADDFNQESANAFLKTLEEPPSGTVLLLLATSLDRQLPTILSRSQVVRFQPLAAADLRAILKSNGVEDDKLARLVRLGGGSAGRALALNDEDFWKLRQTLLDGLTSSRPNFASLAKTWEEYFKGAGTETRGQRLRVSLVLGFLAEALRQSLRLTQGAAAAGLDPAEEARLRSFAERLGADRVLDLIDKCVEADYFVERKVQIILIVESVVEAFLRNAT
ncbi:MAG: DNA polymerase III subunit delta' [Gemmataceae bacterium]